MLRCNCDGSKFDGHGRVAAPRQIGERDPGFQMSNETSETMMLLNMFILAKNMLKPALLIAWFATGDTGGGWIGLSLDCNGTKPALGSAFKLDIEAEEMPCSLKGNEKD